MRILLIILLLVSSQLSFGQELRIGLFRTIKVSKLSVNQYQGAYSIYGDTLLIGNLLNLELTPVTNGVKAVLSNGRSYQFETITIIQDSLNSSFKLQSTRPSSKLHYYRDNLEITNDNGRLRIVNLVDMNNYLGGVIESEGGGGRHQEFYRVQALMSRTYAMKNVNRHKSDGFYLCDGVHCQAYHNMLRHTESINAAVEATRGEVIVDNGNRLIASYFAANCGGQTCDASYVWNNSVPFLESFVDTFCIHTRQATWEKTVPKYKWKNYLQETFGVREEVLGELMYNFEQDQRKAFYIHPSLGVPLRDLRSKFNLKSTYFSTRLQGDNVVISGRGFGHGVGLCQEGAMQMAKDGYSYKQIAYFYFSNVHIIDYYRDRFFGQEADSDSNAQ
ncbi:MAG: SpoIID/LytB domain-containing protein [Crocinitomicaceae bacterium]|nr:SpoIID/LytB domain-containing protein [Crocinitomicaceae bacterium]